jgi:DNA-binding IclR family transcriptional regulator
MHEDVISIAAPIRDYTGEVTAAVSIVGTRQRIERKNIDKFIDSLIQTGNVISLNLGFIANATEKEWSVI